MSAPAAPPAWLKPAKVAELLDVDESTVYRWMKKGDGRGIILRSVRIGKYGARCRADWVDRFMRGEQVPASEAQPEPQPHPDTKTKPGPQRARW